MNRFMQSLRLDDQIFRDIIYLLKTNIQDWKTTCRVWRIEAGYDEDKRWNRPR